MSADPFIQAPTDSQSLNRYSYVLNNPLSMTDPSGFFFKSLFKIALTIAVSYFTAGIATALGASPFWSAVIGGFAGGLAGSGGNLKMGLIGAFTAGAFHGVGSYFDGFEVGQFECGPGLGLTPTLKAVKVIAHGVVGGVSSVMSGGKFMSGFLSSGFTQATSNIKGLYKENMGINAGNAIKAAVIGGTASVLGGGKFANGAVTGAFSRMYNDDTHGPQSGRKINAFTVIGGEIKKAWNNLWSNPRRWSVQLGISFSGKYFAGGGGDVGVYAGVNEQDKIEWGTYRTYTGTPLSTSAGVEFGIIGSWGDIYTNQLRGESSGGYFGIDTPLVDVMYGQEQLPNYGGTIHNLNITFGWEASSLGVVGGEVNINDTEIFPK